MITLPIELLALATEGFWDTLNYQLVGFFIVLVTLTGLWIALEIIGSIFRSIEKRRDSRAATTPIEETAAADPDPEMVAVIAAAIDTFIAQPHEIVSILPHSVEHSKSVRNA